MGAHRMPAYGLDIGLPGFRQLAVSSLDAGRRLQLACPAVFLLNSNKIVFQPKTKT